VVYQPEKGSYASLRINRLVIDEHMNAGVVDRAGWGDCFLAAFHSPVTVEDKSGRHVCEHGAVICWDRASRNYYGNLSQPWLHSCMHFEGPAAESILGDFPCDTVLPAADPSLVNGYFEAIHREIAYQSAPDEVIVRNLLECLLRALKRHAGAGAPSIPDAYIALRDYIRQRYDEPLRIADLAAMVRASPSKLFKDYRRHFGTSPIKERIRAQMEQAHYLMANRNLTLTQIARHVGIATLPYFSRLVKSYFGKPPRAVRAECLKGRAAR